MCKQNLDLCVRELGLNYFQSCSLQKPKSFAKLVGNLIIKLGDFEKLLIIFTREKTQSFESPTFFKEITSYKRSMLNFSSYKSSL